MNDLAFLTRRPEAVAAQEYPVELYLDADGDRWVAESDDLPIATEADSLEALIERVWLIAPEIAAMNGHEGELNLRFVLHTSAKP
jgi:hypothetical protein